MDWSKRRIATYIGKYIVGGIKNEQLTHRVWAGELELTDVELEPVELEALLRGVLPFALEIRKVFVDKLLVTITLTALKTKPVLVEIKNADVELVVHSKEDLAWLAWQADNQRECLRQLDGEFGDWRRRSADSIYSKLNLGWKDIIVDGMQISIDNINARIVSNALVHMPSKHVEYIKHAEEAENGIVARDDSADFCTPTRSPTESQRPSSSICPPEVNVEAPADGGSNSESINANPDIFVPKKSSSKGSITGTPPSGSEKSPNLRRDHLTPDEGIPGFDTVPDGRLVAELRMERVLWAPYRDGRAEPVKKPTDAYEYLPKSKQLQTQKRLTVQSMSIHMASDCNLDSVEEVGRLSVDTELRLVITSRRMCSRRAADVQGRTAANIISPFKCHTDVQFLIDKLNADVSKAQLGAFMAVVRDITLGTWMPVEVLPDNLKPLHWDTTSDLPKPDVPVPKRKPHQRTRVKLTKISKQHSHPGHIESSPSGPSIKDPSSASRDSRPHVVAATDDISKAANKIMADGKKTADKMAKDMDKGFKTFGKFLKKSANAASAQVNQNTQQMFGGAKKPPKPEKSADGSGSHSLARPGSESDRVQIDSPAPGSAQRRSDVDSETGAAPPSPAPGRSDTGGSEMGDTGGSLSDGKYDDMKLSDIMQDLKMGDGEELDLGFEIDIGEDEHGSAPPPPPPPPVPPPPPTSPYPDRLSQGAVAKGRPVSDTGSQQSTPPSTGAHKRPPSPQASYRAPDIKPINTSKEVEVTDLNARVKEVSITEHLVQQTIILVQLHRIFLKVTTNKDTNSTMGSSRPSSEGTGSNENDPRLHVLIDDIDWTRHGFATLASHELKILEALHVARGIGSLGTFNEHIQEPNPLFSANNALTIGAIEIGGQENVRQELVPLLVSTSAPHLPDLPRREWKALTYKWRTLPKPPFTDREGYEPMELCLHGAHAVMPDNDLLTWSWLIDIVKGSVISPWASQSTIDPFEDQRRKPKRFMVRDFSIENAADGLTTTIPSLLSTSFGSFSRLFAQIPVLPGIPARHFEPIAVTNEDEQIRRMSCTTGDMSPNELEATHATSFFSASGGEERERMFAEKVNKSTEDFAFYSCVCGQERAHTNYAPQGFPQDEGWRYSCELSSKSNFN